MDKEYWILICVYTPKEGWSGRKMISQKYRPLYPKVMKNCIILAADNKASTNKRNFADQTANSCYN